MARLEIIIYLKTDTLKLKKSYLKTTFYFLSKGVERGFILTISLYKEVTSKNPRQ